MIMLGLFSVASLVAGTISYLVPVLVALVSGTNPITGTALYLHCPLDDLVCFLLLPVDSLLWPKLVSLLFLGRAGCG
jgi:hypothetical protein